MTHYDVYHLRISYAILFVFHFMHKVFLVLSVKTLTVNI